MQFGAKRCAKRARRGAHGKMGEPNQPGQCAQDLQGRLRPPIRLYIYALWAGTLSVRLITELDPQVTPHTLLWGAWSGIAMGYLLV
jgi:hypothetical protein